MVQHITIVRARTEKLKIYLTDSNSQTYTLAAGEKLIFGVKRYLSDTTYIIKKVITSSDVSNGAYIFTIDEDDTKDLTAPVDYYYDIGLQSGGNYYTVVEVSRLRLVSNVTKKEA